MRHSTYRATLCGCVINEKTNKVLKPELTKSGYVNYKIYKDGSGKSTRGHKIVWEYFNGTIPEGLVIDHINGDRSDNKLNNLRLLSPAENVRDGRLTKLTWDDVDNIRSSTLSDGELALCYEVKANTINRIRNHKRWSNK